MKWKNANFSKPSEASKFIVECMRHGIKVGTVFTIGSGRNEIWVAPYMPIGDKQKSIAIDIIGSIIWGK